ncbi:MAG: PD-(D/E)XK nuclease-like domain-containing protein [Dysgonamonadaceae bacterium]|jgi:hypothetical protein|nr:PD-(D/E)XK nuclease-like domain-containing protein [Dysgonamonadaceae bacterium]
MIPCTIKNLSNEHYHRGEPYNQYLSSTNIKDYLISPKYAKLKREHPEVFEISKEASEKGSLYHACLESIVNTGDTRSFRDSVFVFDPPINEKTGNPYGYETKAYCEAVAYRQIQNPGKQLISQSDLNQVEVMIDHLLNHCRQTSKDICRLIRWGEAEVSHFVEYEGCKFKYRPDLETSNKIVDWKTTTEDDLKEDIINKIILKFKYDISAAFYQFFEHERTGIWKDFYWVFQQKKPPYDAVLVSAENYGYFCDGEMVKMGVGAHKFVSLLNQHIYCMQNNDYDGAQVFIQPGFMKRRIMKPSAPVYETMRLVTYYNN